MKRAPELVQEMRDVATRFGFEYVRDHDRTLSPTKEQLEELGVDTENDYNPTERWLMRLREMVVSWSLISDQEAVIDLLTRTIEGNNPQEREFHVQFLLNATANLLSNFETDEIDKVCAHLAKAISWPRDSAFMIEELSDNCGDEEFYSGMLSDAPWTLYLYLMTTDLRTLE